jgi:anti-sigma B factor antagonist
MSDFTIEQRNDQLQITLTGDLTAAVAPGLQKSAREALQPGVNEVVIDLRHTVMLDSSGIGLLIATRNSMSQRQGRLRVINASPDIMQLLQSMRLVNRLNVTGRTI